MEKRVYYSVILSGQGSVGYPKKFDSREDAEAYYNKQAGGAVLRRVTISKYSIKEEMLASKNLSNEAVKALTE